MIEWACVTDGADMQQQTEWGTESHRRDNNVHCSIREDIND